MKKNIFEEILRKTGEFKEENIKESAEFVEGFVNAAMKMTHALPSYEELHKLLGIKKK